MVEARGVDPLIFRLISPRSNLLPPPGVSEINSNEQKLKLIKLTLKTMTSKGCKKCNASFDIVQEDKNFYKKMEVPEPGCCPSCRMQRRMTFRNERNLYKRKCDLTGKEIISIYPPDSKYTIYDQKEWWGDKWDPLKYGRDFDFSRPFFEQFNELMLEVPQMSIINQNCENCDYGNDNVGSKNCYLGFNTGRCEDCYYCTTFGLESKDCIDMFWCLRSELCYEGTKIFNAYHSFWCFNCHNISDCYFCEDLRGCKNCFGCVGLRRKEYYIFNEKKTKKEFEEFMKNFEFTYSNIKNTKNKVAELRLSIPCKHLQIANCEDCEGDYIENSKNVTNAFDVMNSADAKYIWDAGIDVGYDCYNTGLDSKYLYECVSGYIITNLKFTYSCFYCSDIEYSYTCFNSNYLFGCISLHHKKYCILNKQYKKEEYFKMRDKIIEHMKKTKEYGEFFPSNISTFGYNDTMAQEYFPLKKEEALKQGFKWNDYVKPKPEGLKTVKAENLPEKIKDTPNEVTKWVIECKKDEKLFKIIPQELKFYKKEGLPIPHLCPDCRHYERKRKINPRKLLDRKCDRCHQGIKTNYSPDRPEKVYCESCYLKEIV